MLLHLIPLALNEVEQGCFDSQHSNFSRGNKLHKELYLANMPKTPPKRNTDTSHGRSLIAVGG